MEKLRFERHTYMDGTTAIEAVSASTGEPWCTVTVNLSGYGMQPFSENEIFVPRYKIDDETWKQIEKTLVKKVVGTVPCGYTEALVVELVDNWKEICV